MSDTIGKGNGKMLVHDLEKSEPDFGENGRIEISNRLIRNGITWR